MNVSGYEWYEKMNLCLCVSVCAHVSVCVFMCMTVCVCVCAPVSGCVFLMYDPHTPSWAPLSCSVPIAFKGPLRWLAGRVGTGPGCLVRPRLTLVTPGGTFLVDVTVSHEPGSQMLC